MKRILIGFSLLMTMTVILSSTVFAFSYSSQSFRIEIPEGEGAFYYTASGTNMSGVMLENAQKLGAECLVGVYNNDALMYTFKAEEYNMSKEDTMAKFEADLLASTSTPERSQFLIGGQIVEVLTTTAPQEGGYKTSNYFALSQPCIVFTVTYLDDASAKTKAEDLLYSIVWTKAGTQNISEAYENNAQNNAVDNTSVSGGSDTYTVEPQVNDSYMQPIDGTKNSGISVSGMMSWVKENKLWSALYLVLFIEVLLMILVLQRIRYVPKHTHKQIRKKRKAMS